uniref:TIR domain-containing protein n=1 Tax=Steinernema glaseri TaxID=37863 RepID=A0A1I8AQJ1_9BILA
MDGVPYAFCEAVCATLLENKFSELGELSGQYGDITRRWYPNMAYYVSAVEDGMEKLGYLRYFLSTQELRTIREIEDVPKKFITTVLINLRDGEEENVCREIVKRFPYSSCQFWLLSSSINEAWVDFACSLKRLDSVAITKKLDDNSISLFKKLVDGHKLFWLPMCEKACEGGMLDALKILLCQDQFAHLKIRNDREGPWKSTVVGDLLQFWSENGEKVRGKRLTLEKNCEGGVNQLEKFVLERAEINGRNVQTIQEVLTRCSKEECDFLDKYYRQHNYLFNTPSCVYKFEEGEGDDRQRLYISFDCKHGKNRTTERQYASHEGVDDFSLIRGTNSFHVFFG